MIHEINVSHILKNRLSAFFNLLPRFLIRKLETLIHQKDLNQGIQRFGHKQGLDFVSIALDFLEISYQSPDPNPLDSLERPVIVCNHPLGGLDALVLMDYVGKSQGDLRIFANDLLMNLTNLSSLFVPVNKHGSNRGRRDLYHQAYNSNLPILHFPAGLCSRKKGNRIRDLKWEKSFITLAKRYHRPIVPLFFQGANSDRFYNLANFRRWFGIPFNLEMLFLVDEMFRQKGSHFRIFASDILQPSSLENQESRSVAMAIRRKLYRLSESEEMGHA